ncbi:MAG: type II toxin-antitoxin system RelE/ParE family toxin [Ignavibacteriaceae bacterium]|jgi:plasmid stabilization system protein ParE
MIVEWTDSAIDEFIEILSKHTKSIAEKIAGEISIRVERLSEFPEKGRMVPEFNANHIRELIYKGYRVIYIISDKIYIAHIRNSRQQLTDI